MLKVEKGVNDKFSLHDFYNGLITSLADYECSLFHTFKKLSVQCFPMPLKAGL